jgi:hypothetical protein
MNTNYLTFIIRLRLECDNRPKSTEASLCGSVQQVGAHEILYFDSPARLQETLGRLGKKGAPAHEDAGAAWKKD